MNSDAAFPRTSPGLAHEPGMTIRDYFAAAALTGLLANPNPVAGSYSAEKLGDAAYRYADEALKHR